MDGASVERSDFPSQLLSTSTEIVPQFDVEREVDDRVRRINLHAAARIGTALQDFKLGIIATDAKPRNFNELRERLNDEVARILKEIPESEMPQQAKMAIIHKIDGVTLDIYQAIRDELPKILAG